MKFYKVFVFFAVGIFAFIGKSLTANQDKDVLFQTSTINALLEGVYDGSLTFKELKTHGDFTIGTFNALDGELIGFNGAFYQIKSDGVAYIVKDSMQTPFASITSFEADQKLEITGIESLKQLEDYFNTVLPSKNIFYAIKVEGKFSYVKTRSVPKQNQPYPKLVEVVKTQPVFEFNEVEGTVVGFYCPEYVKGINVPGYHLHFITKDRRGGGHLLECKFEQVNAEIDYTSEFFMVLPENEQFQKTAISQNLQEDLEKVEK